MAKTVAKKAAARTRVSRSGAAKKSLSGPAKKSAPAAKPRGAAVTGGGTRLASLPQPADAQHLAHGLNTLLHTMQVVQQHEEALCSLMHALRRGRATGPLLRELREVLQQLPAQDYLHEVDALRDAVAA